MSERPSAGALGMDRYHAQRTKAEEEMRESDRLLRSFYDQGLVGLAITSPGKGWIRVNQYLCNLLGYSEEELRRMSWTELTYPADLVADEAQFRRMLAGETDGYSLEKRFVARDGRVVPTQLSIRCTRKADGSMDYVTAMVEQGYRIRRRRKP